MTTLNVGIITDVSPASRDATNKVLEALALKGDTRAFFFVLRIQRDLSLKAEDLERQAAAHAVKFDIIPVPSSRPLDQASLIVHKAYEHGVQALFIPETMTELIERLSTLKIPLEVVKVDRLPTVSDLMTEHIVSISPGQSVQEASAIMTQRDIGSLVVLDRGVGVGIITERDIVRLATQDGIPSRTLVRDIMSSPLIKVDVDAPVTEAMALFSKNRIKRLVVENMGETVGIVTVSDLLKLPSEMRQSFGESLRKKPKFFA
jgi:CBS domain-containing protein